MLKNGQTFKLLRCLHRKIFKVCLAIFNIMYGQVNTANAFLDNTALIFWTEIWLLVKHDETIKRYILYLLIINIKTI